MANERRLSFKKTDEVILGDLRRHVMREIMKPSGRDTKHVHTTDLVSDDWCPRRAFYKIGDYPAADEEQISFQLANIFTEGHSIHDKYQRWFRDMGVLWGEWTCTVCKDSWLGWADSAEECGLCFSPRREIKYKEVPIYSEGHLILSRSDGVVRCDDGELRMIEIKTVGLGTVRAESPKLFGRYSDGSLTLDQLWMEISRPFAKHRKQGDIYLRLAREQHPELADLREIIFIYEWKPTQAVRELVTTPTRGLVDELLEDARVVKVAVERGTPPARPVWSHHEGVVCKKCPYRATCWGVEDGKEQPAKRSVRKATSARRRKVLG